MPVANRHGTVIVRNASSIYKLRRSSTTNGSRRSMSALLSRRDDLGVTLTYPKNVRAASGYEGSRRTRMLL